MFRVDFDKKGDRLPPTIQRGAKKQEIGAGKQEPLGGDLGKEQAFDIVAQLEVYGLRPLLDVPTLRGTVTPLIYSLDQPVPPDAIRKVSAWNNEVKADEGVNRRKRAAITAQKLLDSNVEDEKPPLEIEIEQETDAGIDGEKRLGEGLRLDLRAQNGPPKKPGGRQPRKRAA